jgi:hypothetical protein
MLKCIKVVKNYRMNVQTTNRVGRQFILIHKARFCTNKLPTISKYNFKTHPIILHKLYIF